MRRLLLIGIGAGDPVYVTQQAVAALNSADVFFAFDKGAAKDDLVRARREICARYITGANYRFVEIADPQRRADDGYVDGVAAWHDARATAVAKAVRDEIGEDGCGAFLVWGDPALYDSTLRVVERAMQTGDLEAEIDIIPGISSIQVLAARHRIGLNDIGAPVHITTGRQLAALGMPADASVVVMLDGHLQCAALTGQNLDIFWGAALGTTDEILIAGKLDDVLAQISAERAALKAKRGWVMDTYLLRHRKDAT